MKSARQVALVRADSSLLAAATERSKPQRLRDFLNSYDWLNRSVPLFDELSFGLRRLVAGGYIRVSKGNAGITIETTEAGARLGSEARDNAKTLGDVVIAMDRVLGCKPYPEPEIEDRSLGPLRGLTRDDYDVAVAEYGASMEKSVRVAGVAGSVLRRVIKPPAT